MILVTSNEVEKLVALANSGQPDRLISFCIPFVTNITRGMVSQHMDVDDVVQNSLMKIVINLRHLRETDRFYGWVKSLVVREVLTYRRKIGRNREVSLIGDAMGESRELQPQEAIFKAERDRRVQQAVKALPMHERDVVTRFYAGSDVKEISCELDIAIGTVKSRLFSARKRLGKWLEDVGTDM